MRLPEGERSVISDGGNSALVACGEWCGAAPARQGHCAEHVIVRGERCEERGSHLELFGRLTKARVLETVIVGANRTVLMNRARGERALEWESCSAHRLEGSRGAHDVSAFPVQADNGRATRIALR